MEKYMLSEPDENGWLVDINYLKDIARIVERGNDYINMSLEDIEAVVLAVHSLEDSTE